MQITNIETHPGLHGEDGRKPSNHEGERANVSSVLRDALKERSSG